MRTVFSLMLILLLAACEPADKEQDTGSAVKVEDIPKTLADITADAEQKALWQGVDAKRASDMGALVSSAGVVRVRKPVEVPDRAVQRLAYPPLPESLSTGVAVLEVPDLKERFVGEVKLLAVDGDILKFDLGGENALVVQAKIGGRLFSVDKDSPIKLRLQVGDPFARNDILEITGTSSAFAWALVGGAEPVVIGFDSLRLVARQFGKPEGGAMAVEVSVGEESRVLREFAKPVIFEEAGVAVHVLGSIGASGAKIGVLPQDYRLEIAAWPEQPGG